MPTVVTSSMVDIVEPTGSESCALPDLLRPRLSTALYLSMSEFTVNEMVHQKGMYCTCLAA